MSLKLFFLGCLVIFSMSLWGSDTGEFRGETKAKIEILQKQNDELKSKLGEIEKDSQNIEVFKNIIDRQDKRIEDFNILANIIGLWAIVATFISIAVPLFLAYKWKNEAINEAREAASQWFINNSSRLNEQINAFKDRLDLLRNEAENKTNHHTEKLNELEAKADAHLKNLQSRKEKPNKINIVNTQDNPLSLLADQLRTKSQQEYTFEDWNRLAFAADEQKKYEDAMYYWRKAIELGNPTEAEKIQSLINIALTQAEFNRFEEELTIYNDIIRQFTNTENEESKELVAEAMLNKGIRLGKIEGRQSEAVSAYDDLISHFIDNNNEEINGSLSTAMLNKGFELSKLGEIDAAREIYYDLLKQFQKSNNKATNEAIAQALINLFECHLINNEEFETKYIEQLEKIAQNDEGISLQLRMLKIIKNAIKEDQTHAIKNFINNLHQNKTCEDWSWFELDNWAKKLEPENVKIRVISTISEFKKCFLNSK